MKIFHVQVYIFNLGEMGMGIILAQLSVLPSKAARVIRTSASHGIGAGGAGV